MKNLWTSILTLVLGIVITLTIQQMFFTPAQPDMEFLKYKLQEIDNKIQEQDRTINRTNNSIDDRNERIKKDSVAIMLSDRHFRDSLRYILNPPE